MHFAGAPIDAITNPIKLRSSTDQATRGRYCCIFAKTHLLVEVFIWDPIIVPWRIASLHYRGQEKRMQRKRDSSEACFALGAQGEVAATVVGRAC